MKLAIIAQDLENQGIRGVENHHYWAPDKASSDRWFRVENEIIKSFRFPLRRLIQWIHSL